MPNHCDQQKRLAKNDIYQPRNDNVQIRVWQRMAQARDAYC